MNMQKKYITLGEVNRKLAVNGISSHELPGSFNPEHPLHKVYGNHVVFSGLKVEDCLLGGVQISMNCHVAPDKKDIIGSYPLRFVIAD